MQAKHSIRGAPIIVYEDERYYFAQNLSCPVLPELDHFNLPCPSREKEMLRWFAAIFELRALDKRAGDFLQPCGKCKHHHKKGSKSGDARRLPVHSQRVSLSASMSGRNPAK
jgi:hypothetical protein